MARADKAAAVAELTDEFRSSSGAVLTEYRGLTVKQLQELRRALGDHATYAVVKNTLTKIAAKQAGIDGFDALLNGPSAIAFLKGDPVEAAKSLRDFAKVNSPLVIKGGVLDGKPLTVNEIARIADLESREVLLAKLAGAFTASLQGAVFLLNAPLAQAARLVGALQAKAAQDAPSVDAEGTPSEPAVDETPAAPVAEAPDAATADMASAEPAVEETAASASATEETSPVPAVEETTSG